MNVYVLVIIFLVISLVLVYLSFTIKENQADREDHEDHEDQSENTAELLPVQTSIEFLPCPDLTPEEEAELVEIEGGTLLETIDNYIPKAALALANGIDPGQATGQLYQAIIPKGAVLDRSREMAGAVRGSYRDPGSAIKGNANWVAVDSQAGGLSTVVDHIDVVFNIASVVVGQYYMSKINRQLSSVSSELQAISDFQQSEFGGRIFTLVAKIQKCSGFYLEILDNEQLRERVLGELSSLETECSQLLAQANIVLNKISNRNDKSWKDYEVSVNETENIYKYQQVLLGVMRSIAHLNYSLNLGTVSLEYCSSVLEKNVSYSKETLRMLSEWHESSLERLGGELETQRRKKDGIWGRILGFISEEYSYKTISDSLAGMIETQKEGYERMETLGEDDLFSQSVRLIRKDGKVYYLPG